MPPKNDRSIADEVGAKAAHANGKMQRKVYEKELHKLQVELCRLQDWVKETGERIIILYLVSSWPLLSGAFVGTCC